MSAAVYYPNLDSCSAAYPSGSEGTVPFPRDLYVVGPSPPGGPTPGFF